MNLETLQSEMVLAMKNKDKIRKDTLSALVSSVKKAAIDEKCKDNITEDFVAKVILKEKKTVQEMIDTCPDSRDDIKRGYRATMAIIDEYAPRLMSEDEIRSFIEQELIECTSVNMEISPKLKGVVMKNISPSLKGKADMKVVNQILTEMLEV